MAELRTIARHAGAVLVGQLATMAFGVADTVIAGRYDAHALAALSVGAAVYVSIFVAFVGMVQHQDTRVTRPIHGLSRSLVYQAVVD